ncbi:hypothetical protein SM0020_04625 [Sinorhizobium meliloti CCNWSX0020]|uniref:Uncharacterized protein n=1 Tax=Sinorhizobium meliloti CCNWSX0020 TaxID=1107881 RepID=H0FUT3_RHIML|nr:hypothetical protein SM0020_04625 [Sinorhizobium meliloti CCNWSX0020]
MSPLECGDIELHHGKHGFRHALRSFAVRIRDHLAEDAGNDLPGKAPAVLQPAAVLRLAAIVEEGLPDAVELFLVVAGVLD